MLAEAEVERRKPVWSAFAGLWLDTEITEAGLRRIAAVASASGYTIAELRGIYLYEIAPVVGANLLCVAGEWSGFDQTWLHWEARKRAEHRSLWLRLWIFTGIGRKLLTYATERDWQRIVALLAAPDPAEAG